ncbi:UNVERIFIED_CONTAM: hypothetical protein GTU68_002795 [Idotea baltica]|nr:hypothetical protein [Idotea baltica]
MGFYSTKRIVAEADLATAVLRSLPADNGLYMPTKIKAFPNGFLTLIEERSFQEIALTTAKGILSEQIDNESLKLITDHTVNFDAPVVNLNEQFSVLELFHGPSLAFKDFGARFMAQIMGYLLKGQSKTLHILVATSGDTGGAVAMGFLGTPGIQVTILYPSGKVSALQEKQLTTLGQNINAIEIKGSFDDCQALVKQAFLDKSLNEKLELSSANSINIARLIPQSFYYVNAYKQLKTLNRPIAMCVPSGNFGNITAGLLAKKMGLPIDKFIAANNANNVFTRYLNEGNYRPEQTISTISNAMDVGQPSNFQRLSDLFDNDLEAIKATMSSYSFSDEATKAGIKELYEQFNYIACPHTAVAYLGAKKFAEKNREHHIVFQATAHPAKFLDVVEPIIKNKVPIPDALAQLMENKKDAFLMKADYEQFKDYLIQNYC